MKAYLKKLYRNWRYYYLNPEDYKNCMEVELQNNLLGIQLAMGWFSLFAAVTLVGGALIDGPGALLSFGSLIFCSFFIISSLIGKNAERRYAKLGQGIKTSKGKIYFLAVSSYVIIMLLALILDTVANPESPVAFTVLFAVGAIFLLNISPVFTVFVTLISAAIFVLFMLMFKDPDLWMIDISLMTMVIPAAIAFNWFVCLQKMNTAHQKLNLEDIVKERTKSLDESNDELLSAYSAIIMGMSLLSESRDGVTGAHLTRVKAQTSLLAYEISKKYPEKLAPAMVERIVSYSPLHDVGKVGVPDAVLNKAGGLTNEEFEQMKAHTTNGAVLLCQILDMLPKDGGYLSTAQEIAESHHERFDGTGYPNRLKGEQIPLSARIVALADIYDALRSPRAYKPAFSHEQAFDIITKGDGRTSPDHFDPMVLEAFKAVHEEMQRTYDENADKVV